MYFMKKPESSMLSTEFCAIDLFNCLDAMFNEILFCKITDSLKILMSNSVFWRIRLPKNSTTEYTFTNASVK